MSTAVTVVITGATTAAVKHRQLIRHGQGLPEQHAAVAPLVVQRRETVKKHGEGEHDEQRRGGGQVAVARDLDDRFAHRGRHFPEIGDVHLAAVDDGFDCAAMRQHAIARTGHRKKQQDRSDNHGRPEHRAFVFPDFAAQHPVQGFHA
jgi:hypothetical protein